MENQPKYFSSLLKERLYWNDKPWDDFAEEHTHHDGILLGNPDIMLLTALHYAAHYHRFFDWRGGSRGD